MTMDDLDNARRLAAAEWRMRQAEGLSEAEARRLTVWLEDVDNATAFAQADRAWAAFDGADDADLALLRQRVRRRTDATRDRRHKRILGAAAAVVAVSILAVSLHFVRSPSTASHVAASTPEEVVLADGSLIILDAGAKIGARLDSRSREIRLIRGQARFSVAPDPSRPFRVDVGSGVVQAVGTVFNIRRDGDVAVVTLVRGAIDVFASSEANVTSPKRLVAGQQIRLDPTARAAPASPEPANVVRTVETETETVWRSRMAFDDIALAAAVARLNRTSDRAVVLEDAELGALRISGAFDYGDAEGFARAVASLYDLHLVEQSDAMILRIGGG